MLRFGFESFQDSLGILRYMDSLIVLTHEVLDAVEALKPNDRRAFDLPVVSLVSPDLKK